MNIGYIDGVNINDDVIKISGKKHFEFNSIVKTALLVTLAGYYEKDNITISAEKFYDRSKLNKFFSYVLNDKRSAPRVFKLNLKFTNEIKKVSSAGNNNYQCIISFSAGLDSTAGILYALDKGLKVKPVWVGFGQKNEMEELKKVKSICKKLYLNPLIFKVDIKAFVDKGWIRWNEGIIPARNFLFASIASTIASKSSHKNVKIFLCAHKEEISMANTDKSRRFFKTCTNIFSSFYKNNMELMTPFAKVTKPEIISYWKKYWANKYKLYPTNTVSCYFGTSCGNCPACINRAVAFSCSNTPLENYQSNPFKDKKGTIKLKYLNRFHSLKKERQLDFLYSMNANKKFLSKNNKEFLNSNFNKYKAHIKKRILKIQKTTIY